MSARTSGSYKPRPGGWHRWVVRATWDGAVGVTLVAVPDRRDESLLETEFFESGVRPLVGAAEELVDFLSGILRRIGIR